MVGPVTAGEDLISEGGGVCPQGALQSAQLYTLNVSRLSPHTFRLSTDHVVLHSRDV